MISQASPAIDHEKLFQSLATAYIIFAADDPHFTIIDENEAHEIMTLAKRKQIIGRPVLEVFPDLSEEYKETGVSQLIESIRRAIKNGKSDIIPLLKYDLKDPRGKRVVKYWAVTHHPLTNKKGVVTAVCQITQDITESILTREKLERTQHQLEQALSNSAVGTWLWDLSTKQVYADKNFAWLFGLDPAEAEIGMPSSAMVSSVHPGDRERVAKETYQALEDHTNFESEYRVINGNGDVRWVIARGHLELDENGQPDTFPGIVIDVTERRNAENNLNFLTKASVQFSASLDYRNTLSNIAAMAVPGLADWCTIDMFDDADQLELVAVAHKDPKMVSWAKRLRAKQGPPKLDQPGGVQNVLRTGKPAFYPIITDEMLVQGAKDKKELELLRSLGFSSVIIVPMKIDGRPIGAITLVSAESHIHFTPIDLETAVGLANRAALAVYNANLYQAARQEIEERQWLQEQLETANNILESRVKERTKQLEATNEGLEQEIMKRQKAESELQDYSDDLERSNRELQDFAYVASHDLQEPLRKIQAFGDLLESEYGEQLEEGAEYLKRMRNAASRMSVLIEDLLAFSRVSTQARPAVAVNLNTVVREVVDDLEMRAKRTQGEVEIGLLPTIKADPTHMRQLFQNLIGNALKFHRPDAPPIVRVYADPVHSIDKYHTIYVEDNGIGFDEKYLDRIFAVFQRLHGRESYEGTGIGLAVCRKIVERYGGSITATSKKGKGSKFIVQLPKKHKGVKS